MQVNSSAGATGAATTSQASAASTTFAKNFDSFLLLLTQQLKNQDPLQPLSATEFTTQLVQFAGVEQAINQNKSLEKLVEMQQAWQATNALNYIGKTVEAVGRNTVLKDGRADINYALDATGASESKIVIRNAAGTVVRELPGSTLRGSHVATWDGKNAQGISQPNGVYSFAVTAKNAAGQVVATSTRFRGMVSAIETQDGATILDVGGVKVPLADVLSITQPKA
jgi:flagellar basal-body rod modification protein FlgD